PTSAKSAPFMGFKVRLVSVSCSQKRSASVRLIAVTPLSRSKNQVPRIIVSPFEKTAGFTRSEGAGLVGPELASEGCLDGENIARRFSALVTSTATAAINPAIPKTHAVAPCRGVPFVALRSAPSLSVMFDLLAQRSVAPLRFSPEGSIVSRSHRTAEKDDELAALETAQVGSAN